jgi:Arc/MetJ-type ribon-helix-helix transcriptional regulator
LTVPGPGAKTQTQTPAQGAVPWQCNSPPEQEQRIQAVVKAGAYTSAEEALDAALTVVETAVVHGFAGSQEELEGLLMKGLVSKELTEEEFLGLRRS